MKIYTMFKTICKITSCFLPIIFFLLLAEIVCIEWHGFGVDVSGNVYIGRQSSIDVYSEQRIVRTIKLPKYRTYYFTIKADTIYLSDSNNIYTLDLDGKLLSQNADTTASVYSKLQHMHKIEGDDGNLYHVRNLLFRCSVFSEDGKLVYKMPWKDFVAKLYVLLHLLFAAIMVVNMLLKKTN